jgi:hypothetical protein
MARKPLAACIVCEFATEGRCQECEDAVCGYHLFGVSEELSMLCPECFERAKLEAQRTADEKEQKRKENEQG